MRKFGVEIEFISRISRSSMIRKIREETGVDVREASYSDTDTTAWRLKTDASLSAGGLELVTPILNDMDDLQKLKSVIKVLDANGKINSSCGLHVHTDARNTETKQVKKLIKYIAKYELAMNKLVSASRRGESRWCRDNFTSLRYSDETPSQFFKRLNTKNTRQLLNIVQGDRYVKWNFKNYTQHGSVENRMHQGSLNADKIEQWVLLNQAIVNCAFDKRGTRVLSTQDWNTYKLKDMLSELVTRGYMSLAQKSYHLTRAEVLNQ
tara:strand:- start:1979 stop:2773 length:795 start_codon:yes stop_codon:yes gene_type:complete